MSNNKPTHRAFIVRNFEDEKGKDKARWTNIGRVFAHKDGKGFDVILEAIPLDGRVVLRLDEPKPATAPAAEAVS